jgi:hypothetical protein
LPGDWRQEGGIEEWVDTIIVKARRSSYHESGDGALQEEEEQEWHPGQSRRVAASVSHLCWRPEG